MSKFLLGIVAGVVLVFVVLAGGIYLAATLRSKPPSLASGSTLILRLSGDVPEKAPLDVPFALANTSLPFLGQRPSLTVEDVWSMLRRAAVDPRIAAVVFEPDGATPGWARMEEIRSDLEQFRRSGKPLIAYLKSPGARDYYMASACARIYMAPADMLDLKGVALETMYFRNALDKLGVKVDVEHAGKYKDYGDMFLRTDMSPETREVMNDLVDGIFGDLVDAIAKGRGKDAASVRAIIDKGPFISTEAKANGLVDDLRYEDQVFDDLKAQLRQTELKRVAGRDYAAVPDSDAGLRTNSRIAYVVAEGSITRDGSGLDPDSGLESDEFDPLLDRVGKDKDVKGVIVRINSPGGEVMASDEMWRAMNQLRKKKPVVISMSDYGASGGYYMAMSGAPIVAYPATLTGSIGVVFGKPDLHGLYEKLGVTKDMVSRGHFALIESDYASLSDEEREKLRRGIDASYEDFVAKVAAARRKPVSAIEPIAQGRVWLGSQAKANGLVDELGGLDRAIDAVKAESGIPSAEKVSLVVFPEKRSLFDLLLGSHSDSDAADAAVSKALSAAGLGPLAAAWRDAGLRVWMKGGMLRTMPYTIQFR